MGHEIWSNLATPSINTINSYELRGVGTEKGNPVELIILRDANGVNYIPKDRIMSDILDYIEKYTGITIKNITVAESWGTSAVNTIFEIK